MEISKLIVTGSNLNGKQTKITLKSPGRNETSNLLKSAIGLYEPCGLTDIMPKKKPSAIVQKALNPKYSWQA